MDIIALGKAMKAKKEMQRLQDRLGEGVKDIHVDVKTRLAELEKNDPGEVLNKRVSDMESKTHVNINKHNLHMNTVVNKNKFGLTDLVFDDFGDDTGIDASKSTGHSFDSTGRRVKMTDPNTQAEVVTVPETTEVIPQMITVSQATNEKTQDLRSADLVNGVHVDTVNNGGKLELTSTGFKSDGITSLYSPSGSYESPVIDLGDNFKSLFKLDEIINVPTGAGLSLFTATSPDGITFSDYQPVNSDNTITSPSARYIKVKAELTGGGEMASNLVHDFTEGERGNFEIDEQIVFDGSARLKMSYADPMTVDTTYTETGTLLKTMLDKNQFKTFITMEVK